MCSPSELIAFIFATALCVMLAAPVHAADLDPVFDGDATSSVDTSGKESPKVGLTALLGNRIKPIPGGRSTAGSATVPAGVNVIRDFSYGPLPDQKMDIYSQGKVSGAPVIFMVHGGGWRIGGKDVSNTVNNKIARWGPEGFIIISINYPMMPDAEVAIQARNVALALATAQKNAPSWGADASKFILMGHSAGAHLVSLLNANPEIAYRQGAQPWLGTVSLDSGAMNVPEIMQAKHARLYDEVFGTDEKTWEAVSPYYQMTSKAFPWLNVCSSKRDTSCTQSRELAEKAKSLGVRGEVHVEDLGHGPINGNLGQPGAYTQAVETFMASLDPVVAEKLAHPVAGATVEQQDNNGRQKMRGGFLRRRLFGGNTGSND